MITGTLDLARSCLHTSVPLIPGSIRSSSTISAPARSNSASAVGPSATTVASNPSLRNRNASGSASDSSSSTISTLVTTSYFLSVGVFERRDRQRERRPGPRLAPQPDGPVVVGGDVLDDRQAQP